MMSRMSIGIINENEIIVFFVVFVWTKNLDKANKVRCPKKEDK